MSGEKNAIFAFWHGRLLMMAMLCPPKRKMNILISTHGDGEIIARAMHNFGFGTVRGSSTRGGAGAAMRSLTVLEAGENIVITPDGPRGPEMRVQPGIITIAQMTGLPVIFGAFSASRYKHMRSWDRFLLAKPFGCIHYEVSAPMFNVTAESLEVIMRKQIEEVDSKV